MRLRQTGAPVSSIFGLSAFVAQDDDPATIARVDGLYERMWAPGLGLFRDGVLRVPGRTPVERDRSGRGVRPDRVLVLLRDRRARPASSPCTRRTRRVSPLGYGIWADGLGLVLDRLHAEVPGDTAARRRVRHRHRRRRGARRLPASGASRSSHDAIARGVDVRGFFHWTAVDNYEWLHGFDVSFGIIDRDRSVRPSAAVLREAASAGRAAQGM